MAKQELVELENHFQILRREQLNTGNLPLTEYSSDLLEKKNMWSAKIVVHEEELAYVESELEKLAKVVEVEESKILPRKYWGNGQLSEGILVTLGGFTVKPNS